jgi:D-aminoacyl-tRNA deacylase
MQAILQRVQEASVTVDDKTIGVIEHGLLVLFCAERSDTDVLIEKMLAKILKLRIFSDDAGKMNRSVQDVGGGLLIVSQFTLAADVSGGNRPSFTQAASSEEGRRLYQLFVEKARAAHAIVQTGQFAADMKVSLINDGPVTIPIRMTAS